MTSKIAILRGDGIGPEIIAQAVRVLDKLIEQGLDAQYQYAPLGGEAYDQYGAPYPEFTQNLCRAADAVLLGAVGSPQYDNLDRPLRPERGLLAIRKDLNLFANLRPAMARLARSGHLYQVVKDLYLDEATAARLAALVRRLALENKEPVDSAEVQRASNPLPILTVARFRDASGLGRKRAVQMLEFFDRIGLCRRVGDTHVLRLESEVFKGSSE